MTSSTNASGTASRAGDAAKDSAQKTAQDTKDAFSQAQDDPTPSGIQGALENLPSSVYLYGTLGSIALSMLLRLAGRKDFANFVGLWPPTILSLAMINKIVKPSKEM